MITVKELKHLDNIKLEYKNKKYPQCADPNLPRNYSVQLFVASRGAGKTYLACKELKMYEHYGIYNSKGVKLEQRIILISPTYNANPVFDSLKYLDEDDIHHEYSDKLLLEIIEDIKYEKEQTDLYRQKLKIYKKAIKNPDTITQDEYYELQKMNFAEPECKYKNGVVNFLVLDDLIGSSAFKSVGKSALTNLVLKNRHLGINILILAQNLKSIPKAIRNNVSVFFIFRFASLKVIVEDLYQEVSNNLTLENFEKLLDFATQEDHGCLVIDFTQDKTNRYKVGFSKIISINK